MDNNIALEKKRLRLSYIQIHKEIVNKKELSHKICEALFVLPELKSALNILLYYPLSLEVNIKPLFEYCWANGKNVYLPWDKEIAVGKIEKLGDLQDLNSVGTGKLANSRLKIPKEKIVLDELVFDLVLVPGLAFSVDGYRLGRGGGWYDRALDIIRKKSKCLIIGVCFNKVLVDKLLHEGHDIKVDRVISGN